MGCDIHGFVEAKKDNKWRQVDGCFYGNRSYGVFGFLADVRNYSEVTPLQKDRGLPEDASYGRDEHEDSDYHSFGWLTAKELLDFNYDQTFHDMRVLRNGNGAARANSLEEAKLTTYREFLGDLFLEAVEGLKKYGEPEKVRVIFWFDN